jgi:hypothetical protein
LTDDRKPDDAKIKAHICCNVVTDGVQAPSEAAENSLDRERPSVLSPAAGWGIEREGHVTGSRIDTNR